MKYLIHTHTHIYINGTLNVINCQQTRLFLTNVSYDTTDLTPPISDTRRIHNVKIYYIPVFHCPSGAAEPSKLYDVDSSISLSCLKFSCK